MDEDSLRLLHSLCLRRYGIHSLDIDPNITSTDLLVADEIACNLAGKVDGDSKAVTLVSLIRGCDGGIDADDSTADIDERTSAVPGIHRRIRLNEILDLVSLAVSDDADLPSESADDSLRHRGSQPQWIADRENDVAHFHAVGVAKPWNRQAGFVNLDHCEVGELVNPDKRCTRFAAVRQLHQYPIIVGILHNVIVREDVPVRGKNHS